MNEIKLKALASTAGVLGAIALIAFLFFLIPGVMIALLISSLVLVVIGGIGWMIYDDFERSFTRRARKRASSNRD